MRFILLLGICLAHHISYSQSNRIISYDVNTKAVDTLPVTLFDTTIINDHTSQYKGSLNGIAILNTNPPTTNIIPGTDYSLRQHASSSFIVTDYPLRTVVKLFQNNNDTLSKLCSGILIGDRYVLTAAHCICERKSNQQLTWPSYTILVAPAYDDSSFQSILSSSVADRYYIIEDYRKSNLRDLALIKLQEPIGLQTGWISLAFNNDDSYFNNKVFHKFSYPAAPMPWDSTNYTGDTMYYDYGSIDVISSSNFGLSNISNYGIPGQSGSSWFYTDNNQQYFSFGVLVISTQYMHTRVTAKDFYAFKNIIENNTGIANTKNIEQRNYLYPNPASDYIRFKGSTQQKCIINIFDQLGKSIIRKEFQNINHAEINLSEFTRGIYFAEIRGENFSDYLRFVKQ